MTVMDSSEAKFVRVGDTHAERYGHTATLLDDGRVLIVGGSGDPYTAEIYNPETRKFTKLIKMHTPHYGHAAVKLQDGRVLIIGTHTPDPASSAEIFDPVTNTFSVSHPFPTPVSDASATLLPDGNVAIIFRKYIFLYNFKTDEYIRWGELSIDRNEYPPTVLLSDGRVFVVGGVNTIGDLSREETAIGEIVDFQKKIVTRVHYDIPIWGYNQNSIFLLPDGRIFLAYTEKAYIFSPDLKEVSWVKVGNVRRENRVGTLLLSNGKVFLTGDEYWPSIQIEPSHNVYENLFSRSFKTAKHGPLMSEIYDPEAETVTEAGKPKFHRSDDVTVTLLQDGSVLTIGGRYYPKTAELFYNK